MRDRGYFAFGWYGETDTFIERHWPEDTER